VRPSTHRSWACCSTVVWSPILPLVCFDRASPAIASHRGHGASDHEAQRQRRRHYYTPRITHGAARIAYATKGQRAAAPITSHAFALPYNDSCIAAHEQGRTNALLQGSTWSRWKSRRLGGVCINPAQRRADARHHALLFAMLTIGRDGELSSVVPIPRVLGSPWVVGRGGSSASLEGEER